ncbi:MAG: hypothetical protein ED556_00995 [Winogradskyella sp.]|uniref:hypothetical protein n=1 Tax=Winogradskyella sp. TaxID=1883156 RepID=UPI000F3BD82B|nr:hypothetical protein [Winogradskyella sp.]RNC87797.1 MAG: hypothetical protein ED556_00995 [Winogradskyella sp.]
MKFIKYFLLAIVITNCSAQKQRDTSSKQETVEPINDQRFPDNILGSYKGDLIIKNAKGEQIIGMEFHIKATDSVGKYDYQIVYIMDGNRQERNYSLITMDASKGEFVVDENNGILLSAKVYDNRLYSVFEVQGNLLFTIEEFYDDHMIFQIIFSKANEKTESGGEQNNVPSVFSYPISVSQRAKLIKQ